MNEQEWLECTDPKAMLEFLRGKMSDRKERLFAVACCRRTWELLNDDCHRKALEMGERYADGAATRQDLSETHAIVDTICALAADGHFDDVVVYFSLSAVRDVTAEEPDFASSCCWYARQAIYREAEDRSGLYEVECRHQCDFLRDIFNPFRPSILERSWLTPTVTNLAIVAYEERALPSGELVSTSLAVLTDRLDGCRVRQRGHPEPLS